MRACITDFPIPVPSSVSVNCLSEVSTRNIRASYSDLGVIGVETPFITGTESLAAMALIWSTNNKKASSLGYTLLRKQSSW